MTKETRPMALLSIKVTVSHPQTHAYGEYTHTHLEVLLKHGQLELLGAFRIIGIQHDLLAHHVPCKDTDAVLALSAHRLPILEELLSQLVHLRKEKGGDGGGTSTEMSGKKK